MQVSTREGHRFCLGRLSRTRGSNAEIGIGVAMVTTLVKLCCYMTAGAGTKKLSIVAIAWAIVATVPLSAELVG